VDGLVAGDESEQNALLLAGLALLATIIRRSVRRNS
jgi:MYXO-CTERM domain-containing protein